MVTQKPMCKTACTSTPIACANGYETRGAALYVCGSLHGMAEGVDTALRSILGSAVVDDLLQQGRYRRDVY